MFLRVDHVIQYTGPLSTHSTISFYITTKTHSHLTKYGHILRNERVLPDEN